MASKAESARSGIASLSDAHFLLRDDLKEHLLGRLDLAIFLGFKHLFHSMQALWGIVMSNSVLCSAVAIHNL